MPRWALFVVSLSLFTLAGNSFPADDEKKPPPEKPAIADKAVEKIAATARKSIAVVTVTGQREIDGRSMIQLAMPVERGNSGGPLVDLQGKVQGIVTMKSAVTENLGFAVPINSLKPLLAKPNPVAMNRWLTIGALD